MIGEDIELVVTRIERDVVRLAIKAPREVHILRGELCQSPDSPEGDGTAASE